MISERRRSGTTPAPPHQTLLAWWCFPSPIVSGGTYAQKVTFLPPTPYRELAMRLENDFYSMESRIQLLMVWTAPPPARSAIDVGCYLVPFETRPGETAKPASNARSTC